MDVRNKMIVISALKIVIAKNEVIKVVDEKMKELETLTKTYNIKINKLDKIVKDVNFRIKRQLDEKYVISSDTPSDMKMRLHYKNHDFNQFKMYYKLWLKSLIKELNKLKENNKWLNIKDAIDPLLKLSVG